MTTGISARGAQVVAWSYVTVSIAAIFVLLRLFVRWRIVRVIGREDALVSASLVRNPPDGAAVVLTLAVGVCLAMQHIDEPW